MSYTTYGPGDPETWGPCLNHPGDPRTPCDDSSDDLHGEATDEILCTPGLLATFLADTVPDDDEVVPTHRFADEGKFCELSNAQLLALLLGGTDKQTLAAKFELQSRFIEANESVIDERAEELRQKEAEEARYGYPD